MEADKNDETNMWQGNFKFHWPNCWLAVYYDDQFYVAQVMDFISTNSAEIKFLEQTKANEKYFPWPRTHDIAVVNAKFVFA
ncbi:hypothetical protein RRG08_056307 [Elysia crispata]|uniref:Uncharacterized protein n=1 Tax=Elysia crispata TaxID=231223 RepID=A0AAE1BCX7_9GAST|nr:hypothetical protein RRG08_056307 [Elysia crispata]